LFNLAGVTRRELSGGRAELAKPGRGREPPHQTASLVSAPTHSHQSHKGPTASGPWSFDGAFRAVPSLRSGWRSSLFLGPTRQARWSQHESAPQRGVGSSWAANIQSGDEQNVSMRGSKVRLVPRSSPHARTRLRKFPE